MQHKTNYQPGHIIAVKQSTFRCLKQPFLNSLSLWVIVTFTISIFWLRDPPTNTVRQKIQLIELNQNTFCDFSSVQKHAYVFSRL